mmetsp:Transcript_13786/g.22832  ORF Transcript_13786/g.22832 Transcript_13786/m.22832 type:complete len:105 (-) Transcript_13786:204-518(-)|eukprot:CAMPEP_0119003296 /NCGR_PEP_ID=MMETSP1176-20130426/481_1 /TAXON_ID=265551 /ORGANISM="Synedropsis recta cf, Strain CCMP1620" /LENGTH=104 /DNA_ID=CAMNT_0006954885 /DNA_START=84 /DNA_END=398 /DNA_ORIENTATION=+
MMKTITLILALVAVSIASTNAFVPQLPSTRSFVGSKNKVVTKINGFMGGDDEPKTLTRENEPEEFFSTNTDKMSDEEKLPIAIAGLVGISLPFVFGMVALYMSK